jgi:putative oxidoreductase
MTDGKGKQIAVWVLSGALAFMFLFAGGFKLSGAQTAIDNFAKWGYPDWFRIVTGLIEVTAAVLVLVPRTSFYGAALIVPTMVGAVLTHVTHAEIGNTPLPLLLFALAAILGYLRRPERLRRGAFRKSGRARPYA